MSTSKKIIFRINAPETPQSLSDKISAIIDEMIEENNQKIEAVEEVALINKKLGNIFIIPPRQLSDVFGQFISELKDLQNQIK